MYIVHIFIDVSNKINSKTQTINFIISSNLLFSPWRLQISNVESVGAVKHNLVLIDRKASEVLLRLINVLRIVIQNWVSNLHLSVRIKQLSAIELRIEKLLFMSFN